MEALPLAWRFPNSNRKVPHPLENAPFALVKSAAQLDSVFFMGKNQNAEMLQKFHLEWPNLLCHSEYISYFTPEEVNMDIVVVPANYWQCIYWSLRASELITFTYARHSVAQRVFFAHRYYQVGSNPILGDWYNQKQDTLEGEECHCVKGPNGDYRTAALQ